MRVEVTGIMGGRKQRTVVNEDGVLSGDPFAVNMLEIEASVIKGMTRRVGGTAQVVDAGDLSDPYAFEMLAYDEFDKVLAVESDAPQIESEEEGYKA